MYLRGLAQLRLRRGAEAAEAFQVVLDQKGVYWGGGGPGGIHGTYYAPALVGVARAAVLQRDVSGAKQAYERFFRFWKDADSDIPMLIAARKEYAAL